MVRKRKSEAAGEKTKGRDADFWFAQLETHIAHARGEMREIAERLALDMEAALAQVLKNAEAIASDAKRRAFCRGAIDRIDALKIKPRKGRLRDLKRIDALLKELAGEIAATK